MHRRNRLGSEKRVICCVCLYFLARANQYLLCAVIVILFLIHDPAFLRSLFACLSVCSWRDFVAVTRRCYMPQGVPRMILTLVTRPGLLNTTLGIRVFSRVRREFSVLAVGRSHEFRAGNYKDLTETGNCAGKVSGTQGSWTRPRYIFRYVCRTWFSRCYTFLLHAPVWLLHVILLMFYVSFTRPGVCTALDSASVTGPVSCRSGCTARGFVAFSLSCASWPFVNSLRIS